MNKQFYFIRHPKVQAPAGLYGHTDVKAERVEMTSWFDKFSNKSVGLFSSPLQRCSVLANQLAESVHTPLVELESIKEMNFGCWDGKSFEQLQANWSDVESLWLKPEMFSAAGAESVEDFNQRVVNGFKYMTQQSTEHNIVVTHGGVIRQIIAAVMGLSWKQASLYSNLQIGNFTLTQLAWSNELAYGQLHCIGAPL